MHSIVKDIADKAGFCFWEDEEWKPAGSVIDWAAQYDKEFDLFVELLIRDVAEYVDHTLVSGIHNKILERYGI